MAIKATIRTSKYDNPKVIYTGVSITAAMAAICNFCDSLVIKPNNLDNWIVSDGRTTIIAKGK